MKVEYCNCHSLFFIQETLFVLCVAFEMNSWKINAFRCIRQVSVSPLHLLAPFLPFLFHHDNAQSRRVKGSGERRGRETGQGWRGWKVHGFILYTSPYRFQFLNIPLPFPFLPVFCILPFACFNSFPFHPFPLLSVPFSLSLSFPNPSLLPFPVCLFPSLSFPSLASILSFACVSLSLPQLLILLCSSIGGWFRKEWNKCTLLLGVF